MSRIEEIAGMVEQGKVKLIEAQIQAALDEGDDPNAILEGMIGAMGVVGAGFEANEIFVPEMLIAAKTMKTGVEVLKPRLAGGGVGKYGKFVVGTVEGDLHDIGKNLVSIMVESAGFEVVDLGVDVPAEKFVETVKQNPDCTLVGASALLTTTIDALKNTVKALTDAGCKDQVRIMVGGAPITQALADEIGADAYAPDAGTAAIKAAALMTQ